MSVNKVMALIGSIFYTIGTVLVLFLGVAGFIAFAGWSSTGSSGYSDYGNDFLSSDTSSQIIPVLVVGLSVFCLIMLALCVFNWIAFARLDKGKGWKIYLLINGILCCLFCFYFLPIIPGVLFILAFALKDKTNQSGADTPVTSSWNQNPTASSTSFSNPAWTVDEEKSQNSETATSFAASTGWTVVEGNSQSSEGSDNAIQ